MRLRLLRVLLLLSLSISFTDSFLQPPKCMVSLLSQLIKPRQEGRRVYASNNGLKKQHGRSGFPSRSQNIQNSKLLPRDIDSKQPSIPVTTTMRIEEDGMELLPTPPALTIANFVETVNGQNITNVNYSHRVLQCFLSCVAVDELQGTKYGLATPTDIPVMLGYFDSKNFHQVLPNDTIYEGLVEYVAHQLSMDDDAYLLDTPITLTLRGDFDDTEIEELAKANSETASIETDFGGENSWEKLIEEVDKEISHNPHFYDNRESSDEDEQENEEENEENDNSGAIFSRTDPGLLKSYNVPPEAIITEEDAESFRRAHLRADRIFSYVADLKLMGSFHYAKRNYHLVRILEPVMVVGKQITDFQGNYFTLLAEDESQKVIQTFDNLLRKQHTLKRHEKTAERKTTNLPTSKRGWRKNR